MKNIIFYLATVAICLSSCSTDDQSGKSDPGKNVPLTVGSVMTAKVLTTRESSPLNEETDTIGLFLQEDAFYSAINNVGYKYSKTINGWEPLAPERIISLNANDARVCAYYPYNKKNITPDFDLQSGSLFEKMNDFCFSKAPLGRHLNSSNPSASFDLEHVYARITFSFTRTAAYVGEGLIDQITIEDDRANDTKGIYEKGKFNFMTGLYEDRTPRYVDCNPSIPAIGINQPPVDYSVLMISNDMMGEKTNFLFSIDGNTLMASILRNDLAVLAPGKNYQIKVVFNGSGAVVDKVTIIDWTDENVNPGEPIKPVPVPDPT